MAYSLQTDKQIAERIVNRMHGTKLAEDKEDGVWRTIKGRKVFIKKGQSVKDAISGSGKFKKSTGGGKAAQRFDVKNKEYRSWAKEQARDPDHQNTIDEYKKTEDYKSKATNTGKEKKAAGKEAVKRRKEGFKAGAGWLKKNASKFSGKSERDLADALIKELKKSTGMDIEYGDVDELMYDYADGKGGVKIPKK